MNSVSHNQKFAVGARHIRTADGRDRRVRVNRGADRTFPMRLMRRVIEMRFVPGGVWKCGTWMVEQKGFEPSTPTLRTWCSPS